MTSYLRWSIMSVTSQTGCVREAPCVTDHQRALSRQVGDIRKRLNSFIGSKAAVERCAANWVAADSAESKGLRKE